MQAAFLRVKLRRLDEWNQRRIQNCECLFVCLEIGNRKSEIGNSFRLLFPSWALPVWHLFVIRHPQRDVLQQKLAEAGISTLIHYPVPPHFPVLIQKQKTEIRNQKWGVRRLVANGLFQ